MTKMISEEDEEDEEEFLVNRNKRKAKIIDTDSDNGDDTKPDNSVFASTDGSEDYVKSVSESDSESQEIRSARKPRLKRKSVISDENDEPVSDSNERSTRPIRKSKRTTRRKSYKEESDSDSDSQKQTITGTLKVVVPKLDITEIPDECDSEYYEENGSVGTRKSSRLKNKSNGIKNYHESESECQDIKQPITARKSTRLKRNSNGRKNYDESESESELEPEAESKCRDIEQPVTARKSSRLKRKVNRSYKYSESDSESQDNTKPTKTRKSTRTKIENGNGKLNESDSDSQDKEPSTVVRKSTRLKNKKKTRSVNYSDSGSAAEDEKEAPRRSSRSKRKLSMKKEVDTDSDERYSEDQPTCSKRVRKKKSKESDDSDSEENQPENDNNNRRSRRLSKQTLKQMEDSSSGESEHDNMVTPTKLKTNPCIDTPNGSEVRRSARKKRKSVAIPDRRTVLDSIETTPTKHGEIDYYRQERSTMRNNLVFCASTYNQERKYDYANEYMSSGDDDFVVEDDVIYESYDVRKKEVKNKKSRKKLKRKRKVESDENDSDGSENDTDDEIEGGKPPSDQGGTSCKDCNGNNDIKSVMKDTVYSRRATLKEKNEKNKQLEKLQKLRKTKGLSLQERENVLEESEDDSEGGSEADDALNHPYEEKSSDRDFINDSSCDEETDGENIDVKDETKDDKSGVDDASSKAGRVMMDESSSDEDNKMEISLDENEVLFFKAVESNDFETVENILATRAFVNILNQSKDTALHTATKLKHAQMVKLLLELGAKPNLGNAEHQAPALCYAAINKDPECFEILLEVTDIVVCTQKMYEYMEGKNLLHLIVENTEDTTTEIIEATNIHQCIKFLQDHDEAAFGKYVRTLDDHESTPLVAAIKTGCYQGVRCLSQILLDGRDDLSDAFTYHTEEGGNILHMAVQYSARCLEEILPYVREKVNEKDLHGFAPLMYVCELGRYDCFKVLLQAGASIYVQDGKDTTPLHLAAACGNLDIIKHLLNVGHPVDCKDEDGWPPLLYANFQTDKQCVVELFQKNPAQLFCLGGLMSHNLSEERKEKNAKIIQKTLESISHIDTYYTLFNDFISKNMDLLDTHNLGVFIRAWKRILNFRNKVKWLKRKYDRRNPWNPVYVRVDREKVLESAMQQLHEKFPIDNMDVKFKGEEGMCLGPKREFLSCFVKDSIDPKHMIFVSADKKNYSPSPNSYFLKKMKASLRNNVKYDDFDKKVIVDPLVKEPDLNESIADDDLIVAIQIQEYKEMAEKQEQIINQLRFLGRFVAHVILSNEDIELYLTKSFVQQILGEKLSHPDVLSQEDSSYYNNVKDNNVDDLCLPFSTIYHDPWSNKPEDISLSNDKNADITEENKNEYLKCLSKFLYQDLIIDEVKAFKSGFNEVVYKDDMEMFTADEFSLLLNGVRTIDIKDWKSNTRYVQWKESDDVIMWFWRLVESLKEDEKSLMLKFVTGTPCVPLGGFKNLGGLGGSTPFTIAQSSSGCEMLPSAATCFNLIRLPKYQTEEIFRDKILIAIRHGSEGFAFS